MADEKTDRDAALDAIEKRYVDEPEDMERDAFREALNEAYNAGLLAQDRSLQPKRWQWGDGPVKCFTCDNMVPEPSVCESCYPREAKRELQPSTRELIARLRRSVTAGIFGIPAEAVAGIQDDISELEKRIGGERG